MSQARHYETKDSGVEWIGEIPREWSVKRGKNILHLLSRPILPGDDIVTCFRDGEVTLRKNRREEGFTNALVEAGYQGVEPGDLVVHGMDGFAGAIGVSDSRGKSSPVLNVLDSSENKRFLMYYLRATALREVFLALSTGIRVRSCDLRWNKLAVLPYILPPLPEQTAIVAYLDEKCATIDALVAEAKATIEEYKAWRASVIFEAVTKGLDPNAEMKDSGVEWIGMMPSNWQVKYLFQFVSQVKNKNNDLREKNLLSLSYGKIKRKDIETTDGLLPASFDGYNIIEEGDIVMRLTDLQNDHTSLRVGRATERGIITSAYTTVRPSKETSPFLYLALHSFDVKKGFYGMGAGVRQGLNYGEVKKVLLPFPPANEQQTIVAYLNEKCAVIDSIITEKEALIGELETYKKSLIFETVTGKRRVC